MDITAELHESKEAEVKLIYERGELIAKAKIDQAWIKAELTESQYFQGLLGITRVEEEFAEDVYIFIGEGMKDFEGLTMGKIRLVVFKVRDLMAIGKATPKKSYDLVEKARNLLYNDLRDELKGEADDGKCTSKCDIVKEIKESWYCRTHKKRFYIDPTGKLDK